MIIQGMLLGSVATCYLICLISWFKMPPRKHDYTVLAIITFLAIAVVIVISDIFRRLGY